MCLNVSKILNIFMNDLHNNIMEIMSSLIVYTLLNIVFISTQFLTIKLYYSIVLFLIYCLIIKQYYRNNLKTIEFKDLIFSISHIILLISIYLLFEIHLNNNEIMILFTITFISIIFYTSQLRNR